MNNRVGAIVSVVAATAWIGINEFVRNEFLFKGVWVDHYAAMGLDFPDALINGGIWGVWSLAFAAVIRALTRRFTFLETAVIAWVAGFVLMWLAVGNLGALPFSILWFAVPWSMLEVAGATALCSRISPPPVSA